MKRIVFVGFMIASLVMTLLPIPEAVKAQTVGCPPGAKFNINTGQPCATNPNSVPTPASQSASCLNLPVNIAPGTRSALMPQVQNFLKAKGFFKGIATSENFGPQSVAAVKAFQIANGISPVGNLGPITRLAIMNQSGCEGAVAPAVPVVCDLPALGLRLHSKGAEVIKLQAYLKSQGDFTYPSFTQNFGPVTDAALKRYQTRNRLAVTGVVDAATLAHIRTIRCRVTTGGGSSGGGSVSSQVVVIAGSTSNTSSTGGSTGGGNTGGTTGTTGSGSSSTGTQQPSTPVATQTYTITSTAGSNGVISPSGATTVNAGATQNITIIPNSGYEIASVTINGIAQVLAGTYSFTNISQNHTIAATFSLIPVVPPEEITSSPTTPPPSGTAATINGINIPSAHPRIWWNAERLAQARAWYQSNPFTPSNSNNFELALAYQLTGNAAYCTTAINWLMNFTIPAGQALPTAIGSDYSRWEGENAAIVFDWCYDRMTPSQRSAMVTRWTAYIDAIRQQTWGGPAQTESNYNWGNLRNEINWGIALYGESTSAASFINWALDNRWENNFVPYALNRGKGGIFQEGAAYGSSVASYSIMPFITASLNGRHVYNETDYFKGAVLSTIYSTTPTVTVNNAGAAAQYQLFPYADDERFRDGGLLLRQDTYPAFMAMAADYWRDIGIGQYARQWLNYVGATAPRFIRSVDRGGSTRAFSTLPLDYYGPGSDMIFGRTGWGTQATTFHLQLNATHDEGHKHADEGNWQMWRNGQWVSRETTGYAESIAGGDTYGAIAHNTFLINGRGSVASTFRNGLANVKRVESRPEYTYAATDLTPLYRASDSRVDNTAVGHIEREFIFIRGLETMVIFDRAQSTTAAATKTFLAHLPRTPTLEDANHVTGLSLDGSQALRITTLVPSNPTRRVVANGGGPGQYRLELETSGATQSYMLNVLQAKDANGANVNASVVDNGSSYTVTLTHPTRGTATITLQKGSATSGGTITVSGTQYNLLNRVQNISITNNGPVWESLPAGTPVGETLPPAPVVEPTPTEPVVIEPTPTPSPSPSSSSEPTTPPVSGGTSSVSGLAAQWKFDNNATESVTGNGSSARGTVAYSADVAPISGTTASMNFTGTGAGTDTYIASGANVFNSWSGASVSMWLKVSAATANSWANGSTHTLIDKYRVVGIKLIKDSSGVKLQARHGDAAAIGTMVTSSSNIPTDSWVHVATVHTGSTITLYINGTQVGSGSTGRTLGAASSDTFSIGEYGGHYAGLMDDVHIYNRALSSSEINQIRTN